jgi:hypothetical protein
VSRKRNRTRYWIGAILLALLVGAYVREASRRDDQQTDDDDANVHERGARVVARESKAPEEPLPDSLARPIDVPTEAQLDAGVVPQPGPGQVVVRRQLWDSHRAREGLPPVDPAVIALEDLPVATDEQANDPDAHQLYVLEREIRTAELLAEHEDLEGTRFGLEALKHQPGPARRAIELAASEHAALAKTYRERALALQAERRNFIEALVEGKRDKE